jgi:hypothetical protein
LKKGEDLVSERFNSKKMALMSVFSVIYLILRMLPTFPMVGVGGAFFSISDVIAPIYGILLGPITGPMSIAIGTFLAIGLGKPAVFLGLDFLPAFMNALSLGLLIRKKWLFVVILNFILLIIFSIHPYTLLFVNIGIGGTGYAMPFAWMHMIAFLLLLSPLSKKAVIWISKSSTKMVWVGSIILFFIGTFIQHLTGNILFESILGMFLRTIPFEAFPPIWTTIFWLYPIERTTLIIISSIAGVFLIRSLIKINFERFNII